MLLEAALLLVPVNNLIFDWMLICIRCSRPDEELLSSDMLLLDAVEAELADALRVATVLLLLLLLEANSVFSGDAMNRKMLLMAEERLLAVAVLGVSMVVDTLLRVGLNGSGDWGTTAVFSTGVVLPSLVLLGCGSEVVDRLSSVNVESNT